MRLHIKYMVSPRCKIAVKEELRKFGLHFIIGDMGVADIMENITADQREKIRIALLKSGLELIDDKKALLIEKIKDVILDMVYNTEALPGMNFSEYLSNKLNCNYATLSNLFSEVEGTTIEKLIISHKIERVKEFIIYNELNLTEIGGKLNYSSVAQLSSQFKKVTGLTPSYFKKLNNKRRELIAEV